jgi:hypothetical protein
LKVKVDFNQKSFKVLKTLIDLLACVIKSIVGGRGRLGHQNFNAEFIIF